MFKAFRLAVNNLFANPVRTGLTTLGIIIGISTVILVLSAGAGFRSLINDQVAASGTNLVEIQTKVPQATKNRSVAAAASSRGSSSIPITTLKKYDLDVLKRLPNIVNAYGLVLTSKVVSYRDTVKQSLIYGCGAERFTIDKHTLKEGRFYTQQEDNSAAQVAVIGSQIAIDMFNQDDPVGKLIRVGDLNFQVIGVYNSLGATGGGTADQSLFIPLNTVQRKIMGVDYMTAIIAQIDNPNLIDLTTQNMTTALRQDHHISNPDKDDFAVQSAASALDSFNTIFNGITILLIAIAAISLIVGGVGIMNIMYVVVTERTSEIGLKKALGAKNADILNEFLVESILVTLIGGILGIIFGAFFAWVIALVARSTGLTWDFVVPGYAIFIGVGVSAVIGIGFGVLPARQAAKMDPIAALQYE